MRKDDVLTLLIHLGYLGYDAMSEEAFIPNKEIIMEFENAMSVGGWSEVINVLKVSEKLLEDTLRCDEKSVAEGLDKAHTEVASIPAIQQIKDRNYVQALEGYVGDILLVGISYKKDCTNKPHHCVIERIQKESKPFS